jgi:FAD:protein FMN transferase
VHLTEARFRVMACDAHVILVGADAGAGDHARRRLEDLERRWSRFRGDSDVSRLNSSPAALLVVALDTVRLVTAMKEAWARTGGRYDPTLLGAINALGYATSADGSGRASSRPRGSRARRGLGDVRVHDSAPLVSVPEGVGLDPGGIGKGLAADIVVRDLIDAGAAGALVGVGGDLACAGTPPEPHGWRVAVEDPLERSRTLTTLALGAGGAATSSTLTRSWVDDGERRHHVIDPSTGASASTDLAAVTVFARAGWEAEAHATAALLAGSRGALDYLDQTGLQGIVTTLAGVTTSTPGLASAGQTEWSAA